MSEQKRGLRTLVYLFTYRWVNALENSHLRMIDLGPEALEARE